MPHDLWNKNFTISSESLEHLPGCPRAALYVLHQNKFLLGNRDQGFNTISYHQVQQVVAREQGVLGTIFHNENSRSLECKNHILAIQCQKGVNKICAFTFSEVWPNYDIFRRDLTKFMNKDKHFFTKNCCERLEVPPRSNDFTEKAERNNHAENLQRKTKWHPDRFTITRWKMKSDIPMNRQWKRRWLQG